MDLWLPGYEHDPEHGAGLSVTAGRPKVVIHTTESGPGSFNAIRSMWRGSGNWGRGLPHFLAEGARYVQLLPLNVAAYTLQNRAGGADTNRSGPAIQVEIIGYARNDFTDTEVNALGWWLADLVRAGVALDLAQHPRFYGEGDGIVLASESSPIRMSAAAWTNFNGFCGHQHAAENSHWDPGRLDADRVEAIARARLAGAPAESERPEEDDEMLTIYWSKAGSAWVRDVAKLDSTISHGFAVEGRLMTYIGQRARPGHEGWDDRTTSVRNILRLMGHADGAREAADVADSIFQGLCLLPAAVPAQPAGVADVDEAAIVAGLRQPLIDTVRAVLSERGVDDAEAIADELAERLAS